MYRWKDESFLMYEHADMAHIFHEKMADAMGWKMAKKLLRKLGKKRIEYIRDSLKKADQRLQIVQEGVLEDLEERFKDLRNLRSFV